MMKTKAVETKHWTWRDPEEAMQQAADIARRCGWSGQQFVALYKDVQEAISRNPDITSGEFVDDEHLKDKGEAPRQRLQDMFILLRCCLDIRTQVEHIEHKEIRSLFPIDRRLKTCNKAQAATIRRQ